MRLLYELQRRKVVRTTVAYLVAAFVAAQVVQLLVEALQLSARILKAFVVLEIVAIPIVIGLAWAFDITRTGVKVTDAEPDKLTPFPWRRLVVPAALAVALLIAGTFYVFRDDTARAVRSIAVLPFENTSGTASDDYFSDGMTDELSAALARLPGLRLAGRTSSYMFKGKAARAQDIGRALSVNALIAGTVRRAGDRLRVTAQLVDAADGKVVWDSVFESRSGDVFAMQDEFTRAIVDALERVLGARPRDMQAPNLARGTADPEAYDLYMKGRYYWLDRNTATSAKPIALFQQAIARDPKFARAYASLALAYMTLTVYQPDAADTVFPLIQANARKALALNPRLADAHIAMGLVAEWQMSFSQALSHYRAAIAIEPDNPTAHHTLGGLLVAYGRTRDGLDALRRATRIDPLAKSAGANLALALVFARQFPEASAEARRVLSIDSTFVLGLHVLGGALEFGGQPDSAIQTLEKAAALYPEARGVQLELIYAYAAAGRWEEAQQLRAAFHARTDRFAMVAAGFADLVMGNKQPMVSLLLTKHGRRLFYAATGGLGCNPLLDPLWSDARFTKAMQSIDVAVCPLATPWPLPKGERSRSP